MKFLQSFQFTKIFLGVLVLPMFRFSLRAFFAFIIHHLTSKEKSRELVFHCANKPKVKQRVTTSERRFTKPVL